jgi:hypothetical protein
VALFHLRDLIVTAWRHLVSPPSPLSSISLCVVSHARNLTRRRTLLQIGFSLSFGSALLPSSGIHTHEMDDDLAASLLASLRQLGGLPSRLSKMLKDSSTVVSMSVDDDCALLRLKVRQYVVPPGDQEQYAAALQAHAGKNRISIDNTHYVVDVSVAVPARIPREIDRHSIVRLGMLVRLRFSTLCDASHSHYHTNCRVNGGKIDSRTVRSFAHLIVLVHSYNRVRATLARSSRQAFRAHSL